MSRRYVIIYTHVCRIYENETICKQITPSSKSVLLLFLLAYLAIVSEVIRLPQILLKMMPEGHRIETWPAQSNWL